MRVKFCKDESGKTLWAMVDGFDLGVPSRPMRKDKGFAESWNTT